MKAYYLLTNITTMQIEKIPRSFYNQATGEIEEKTTFKISFRELVVWEETLDYAFRKLIVYARHKKLLTV